MRHFTVILAVTAVLMVAGANFAYFYDPGTEFSVEYDSGTADVSVSGTLPTDISYKVLSDTHVPDKLYFYLDPDYSGGLLSYRTQEKNLTSLKDMLADRGYDAVEIIDAEGLAQLCSDASAASVSGIFMTSGVLPDTVYPNDSENGILTWLSNGGTLYWCGPDIGSYRGDIEGKYVETGNGYFGDDVNSSESNYVVSEVSEVSDFMGFAACRAECGLKSDYAGSRVLGLYGDYSSFSVVPVGSGRAYVMGAFLNSLYVESFYTLADIIVCGITENTVLKDSGTYHKGFGSGSFSITGTSSGDVIYVSAGKTVSVCGQAFFL